MRALILGVLLVACSTDDGGSTGTGGAGSAGKGSDAGSSGGSAGSAGSGGSAGSAGSGGSPGSGGGAGSGGSVSSGGSGGSAATDAGSLCADRTGGALITFEIAGEETLTVWVEDSTFIDEALALLASGDQRIPSFGDLLEGSDCDSQWSWHPDPTQVSFADFTVEVCDGRPSDIESNKSYWLNDLGYYCPWSARVVSVDDRR
jgi:hypothetical protein